MPRGNITRTPMQKAGAKANATASRTMSPYKPNNAYGVGGMNIMPKGNTGRGNGRGPRSNRGPKSGALEKAIKGVGSAASSFADKVVPANRGSVNNSSDPTSALSMLRRKAASREPDNSFISNGKSIPYRNDKQKNGY